MAYHAHILKRTCEHSTNGVKAFLEVNPATNLSECDVSGHVFLVQAKVAITIIV
jgi:hypothetical protein